MTQTVTYITGQHVIFLHVYVRSKKQYLKISDNLISLVRNGNDGNKLFYT